MAKANEGRTGRESWREYNVVNLDVLEAVGAANRGRKEDSIDRVVICAAAMLID